MEKSDPNSDEYKEMESYLTVLESEMLGVSVELCHEVFLPNKTLRIYRAYQKSGALSEVPAMNIIEIEYEGYYVYAYTQLEPEDLK